MAGSVNSQRLGQCHSVPTVLVGSRTYCYTELAVSPTTMVVTIAGIHCAYPPTHKRMARLSWPWHEVHLQGQQQLKFLLTNGSMNILNVVICIFL